MFAFNIYLVYLCTIQLNNKIMENTKSEIQILETEVNEIKCNILIINEEIVKGGGINQTNEENTIYDYSIIYEF